MLRRLPLWHTESRAPADLSGSPPAVLSRRRSTLSQAALAVYAAEAGVADAKNRLRAVWTTDETVAFPDQGTAVAMGDTGIFPYGQPTYYADPLATAGIEFMNAGSPSVSGGHDQRLGGSTRVNTLWRIRVAGRAPGDTVARLEVVATRELDGGY